MVLEGNSGSSNAILTYARWETRRGVSYTITFWARVDQYPGDGCQFGGGRDWNEANFAATAQFSVTDGSADPMSPGLTWTKFELNFQSTGDDSFYISWQNCGSKLYLDGFWTANMN